MPCFQYDFARRPTDALNSDVFQWQIYGDYLSLFSMSQPKLRAGTKHRDHGMFSLYSYPTSSDPVSRPSQFTEGSAGQSVVQALNAVTMVCSASIHIQQALILCLGLHSSPKEVQSRCLQCLDANTKPQHFLFGLAMVFFHVSHYACSGTGCSRNCSFLCCHSEIQRFHGSRAQWDGLLFLIHVAILS